MNKRNLSILILALIIMTILAGCGIEKNIEATENMKKGVHTEIEISSEAVQILGEETIIEISYPKVVDMKDRKIQESVNETLKEFSIKQHELLRQNSKILYTDYETTYVDDEYLSILFKYAMSSEESDADSYKLFSAINVDLKTGLFINWDDFMAMFEDEYTADDKEMISFRIDEMKADNQVNPLKVPVENTGMYRNEDGINIFYYDGMMQTILLPKHTIAFMFPEYAELGDDTKNN